LFLHTFSCLLLFLFVDLIVLCYRGNEITLVLWGARAREFDSEAVHAASEEGAVIVIFVGTLPKMYRGDSLLYTFLVSLFVQLS
jgi:hypothetical protein